jgi:glycosyltransferase XagB
LISQLLNPRSRDGQRSRARRSSPPRQIGELLIAERLVTREQLEWALEVQARTGSRVGEVLVSAGVVSRPALYQALANLWRARYVDVTKLELDPALGRTINPSICARDLWVPVARTAGGFTVATAQQPTTELRTSIERALAAPVDLVVTSEWDIDYALRQVCREAIVQQASYGLWQHDSELSARTVLSRGQGVVLATGLVALVAGLIIAPAHTITICMAIVAVGFFISVAFKFVVCLVGAYHENLVEVSDAEIAALDDADLPVYTILVPCYREANVVTQLMTNLACLDYPHEKLNILLLLEEDDDETRDAAAAAQPPSMITFVTVPAGQPQTKPRACNVGLIFARGEYLVIYDAEDRPDPDQLKRAVAAFRKGGPELVCVQAALNYFNADQNLLTRMFTLEYSFWFDYMLRGLASMKLPIPLGGTSNHFRTDELRLLGGWDPFNVTEDADLGIRAAALGQRVGVINSTTFEEANSAYGNFIRQRSRWIKGYLQTTLVHARHPIRLVRSVGIRQALGFVLLIAGTPISFLALLPLYLVFGITLALNPATVSHFLPGWVLWVSLANLLVGNGMMVYVSMMGVFRRHSDRLVLWALLNPFYWLLHCLAAYKALGQLILRPHYWEKTDHGLSSIQPSVDPH